MSYGCHQEWPHTFERVIKTRKSASYRAATKYFGENAENYENIRNKEERWGIEQEIVRRYVETLPHGARIADIPFGTGRFVPFYIKQHLNVFGADISEDMLKIARKNIGDAPGFKIQVAAAEALPLPSQSVDYLICHRFIKWLPDTQVLGKVMKEFARVTRKEMFIQARLEVSPGLLEIMRQFLGGKLRKKKKTKSNEGKVVTSKFTGRDIRRAIRAAGLRIFREEQHPEVSKGVTYYTIRQR